MEIRQAQARDPKLVRREIMDPSFAKDEIGWEAKRWIEELLALLRRVEWVAELQDYLWEDCCPDCRRRKEEGHAPDCELAKALKGGE
jgi:hypothetical protein